MMNETHRFVGFTEQGQAQALEGFNPVGVPEREGETMLMTGEQATLHPVEADVVHVDDGVCTTLNAHGGEVGALPEISAALQRVPRKVLTLQHHAHSSCVGPVGDHLFGRNQGQVHLEFCDATVQGDRFHAVLIGFHDTVVVDVVEPFEPRPHFKLACQPFRVAELKPQSNVLSVHGNVAVRNHLLPRIQRSEGIDRGLNGVVENSRGGENDGAILARERLHVQGPASREGRCQFKEGVAGDLVVVRRC